MTEEGAAPEDDDRLAEFLEIVSGGGWRDVPRIWNEQIRAALSDDLIKIGWGGVLEITDAGKARLTA